MPALIRRILKIFGLAAANAEPGPAGGSSLSGRLDKDFLQLLESVPDAMVVVSGEGRITLVNSQTERLFGYSREELLGRDFELLLPERYRPQHRKHRDAYFSGPRVRPMGGGLELWALRKDGSELSVDIRLSPGETEDGIIVFAVIRDITDRRKAELEIHELNEQLEIRIRERTAELQETQYLVQSIIDNSTAVIYVKDTQGRYLLANRRFTELFNKSGVSLLGKSDHDLFPASMAQKFRENDMEVLRSGKPLEIEEVALHDDGPHTYISLKFSLLEKSGTAFAVCGISTDITDRKQAEREIAESRERYRVFFDNSPISLWEEDFSEVKRCIHALRESGVSDIRGYVETHPDCVAECAANVRVLDVNKATLEMYEAQSKTAFLAGLRGVLPPNSYAVFREEIIAIAEGATTFESENINTTLRGRQINIYLRWSVVPGFEDTYSKVLVSIVDVTERRRAEEALIRFGSIVESSDEAIIGVTLEGIVMSWNMGAERTYGYRADEAIGQFVWMLIAPDNPQDVRQLLERILRGDQIERFETQRQRKDGSRIDVMLTLAPIRDRQGRITGASSIARDITGQKRIEKQIRLLARALESTSEMICISNLENRIIFVNRAFLETYGYPEHEVLGKNPAILRSPRNPVRLADQIFEHSLTKGWMGELLNRKKDGTEFPVHLNTSPIRDADGDVLGLIGVARDISDIVKAEEALWEAARDIESLFEASAGQPQSPAKRYELEANDPEKRKRDLARDIGEVAAMLRNRARQTLSFSSLASHQLRTPLTILRSQLENALRPDLLAASLRRTLSSTYDEILRLSHVVDVLLNLSRMQAGTLRPELQEVDFHSLLKEFHLEALVLAREKKISFKFVEGGRLSIQADPGQLRQVLLNLLDNAIKYTPVKGSIETSYTVEENELVFQISNSGEGIAPGIVPKIFDPFRSGEKENALNQGTGLGLALVKWIVEGHRGTVEVRSTPGEDTTFVIRLPIRAGS